MQNQSAPVDGQNSIKTEAVAGSVQPRLVCIPNGAWICLKTVTSIKALPTERTSDGATFRARVVVRHSGQTEVCMANDDEHAQTMANQLAAQINSDANV